eukprot:TRINITY_DN56342_c0_g4_i2.p1 TRINITY_DN56342_c0_g4~~TRINITY_DN56342_c0_g4_i2.p1  ORF type:complete len:192 (-),score=41.42 TRINITY_DN56342_c0_g4_i2:99-674(-)
MAAAENVYRIVVLGSGAVGKSSITLQAVHRSFVEEYDPTIEDSYRKQTEVNGEVVIMEILDTAGQEEFKLMRDQHMEYGQGFVVVFALNERPSFDEAKDILGCILRAKDTDHVPAVLVGNKSDLPKSAWQVTTADGAKLAETFKAKYMEASAKERINIDEIFHTVVGEIQKTTPKKKKSSKPKIFEKCSIL